jgi:predicted HTH transcriptional regulator
VIFDALATESRQRPDEDRTLMDPEELRQLVAQGESDRLELKKTTGELKAGMKTLCAMLNGSGGRVVFGVTPGGRVVGQDVTDPTLREVAQEIHSGLENPPAKRTLLDDLKLLRQLGLVASGGRGVGAKWWLV